MMMNQVLRMRVTKKWTEAQNIVCFELVGENNGALPPFEAGAHLDVITPSGQTRQYSLCNSPGDPYRYQIAVLRDPGSRGGSVSMHDQVLAGDFLTISSPKNHFPLVRGKQSALLLAGGIGVTPILSMAEYLTKIKADFEMHYCTRTFNGTAFSNHIKSSAFAEKVYFHFDDGVPAQKLDISHLLELKKYGDTHLYVCGPKGFMDAVLSSARAQGWPENRLHFEFFGATVPLSGNDRAFELELMKSGRIISVGAEQTALQVLLEAGVDIPYSCEQGVCGTCVTRVIRGEPDHKDMYLTPQEHAANEQFLPCCSRSKTDRLVIDL